MLRLNWQLPRMLAHDERVHRWLPPTRAAALRGFEGRAQIQQICV